MSDNLDDVKELKRKANHGDQNEASFHSEKKRRKKEGKTPKSRPKHYPLSERQQLALLMQMTAEENNEQAATPPSTVKKTPGSSGRKDKINKRNERGETPLHLATIRGELSVIIDLVKQGADINVQDYAGWTPLHEACNHGYQDIAQFLLEAGASVNSKGLDNDYPLHDAVTNEHVDLVELLLKHGANPLLANKNGERPLDMTDNEEIKRLMQNEVISSDESDRNASPLTLGAKAANHRSSKAGRLSESNLAERPKPNNKITASTASRELFKKTDVKRYDKHLMTSSDSDDSDDVPLIRQRKNSTQSSSMSFSSSSVQDVAAAPPPRMGDVSGSLFEKDLKTAGSQKRLYSTESYDSMDSDAKISRSRRQPSDAHQRRKQSVSSEDEVTLPCAMQDAPSKNILSTEQRSEDSRASSLLKKPTVTIASSKLEQSDVYDFSPNADDFSMEGDGISLKPDNRSFPKWETPGVVKSSTKPTSLFPRKPQSIFSSSKGFDFNAKKARKTSWDNVKPSQKNELDSGEKTATIRPVLHETSEMMFDRIFKSPKKESEGFFNFDGKLKGSLLSPKHTPSTTISNVTTTTVTTLARAGAIPMTSVFSGNSSFTTKVERTKTFAPSLVFSSSAYDVNSAHTLSRNQTVSITPTFPTPSKIYSQGDTTTVTTFSELADKSSKGGKLIIDASKRLDKSLTKSPPVSLSLDSGKTGTTRSLSLDTGSKVEVKKKIETEKPVQIDPPLENKPVKKLIKAEIKEKLSKTVSDPVKKVQPKPVAKDSKPSTEGKKPISLAVKSAPQTPPKKDANSDPKKVLQLLDSKSNFMDDIESVSRQRHQKKLKRKKLILKKGKSSPLVRPDEKKIGKKPEVKLLDTDSWLGSPTEKSTLERQKKSQQRSVKKLSDASVEPSLVPPQQDDKQLPSNPQSETVSQSLIVSSPPVSSASKPDAEPAQLAKLDILKPLTSPKPEVTSLTPIVSKPTQYPLLPTDPLILSPDLQGKFSPPFSPPHQAVSKSYSSSLNQGFATPERLLSPTLSQLSADSSYLTSQTFYHIPSKQPALQNTPQRPFQVDQSATLSSTDFKSAFGPVNEERPSSVPQTIPTPATSLSGGFTQENVPAAKVVTSTTAVSVQSSLSTKLVFTAAGDTANLQQPTTEGKQSEAATLPAGDKDANVDTDISKVSNSTDTNETIEVLDNEPISEEENMLQEYIKQRLSLATIRIERVRRKRLPVYIPLHELMERKKDPAVDKLNVYEERVAIQKKMFEKRKKITTVVPQAPQCYWEYMTFTGGYLLNGSKESHLSVPVLAPPPFLCEPMIELFNAHEERRVRLRVQHAIQREKLIMSCEQEIMRVHSRAARTIQNQQVPFSACSMLMDNEVYNMPRASSDTDTGKTSIRDRFNGRMFISWLQDVDDKYGKMKSVLLARQKHEAEAMFAVQKTEWVMKRQELDHSQRVLKADEINEVYVPMVNIADDFDLLPA